MHINIFSFPILKKTFLIILYILYLLLLIEFGSRCFWTINHNVPFFKTEEIVYFFYPELRNVKKNQLNSIHDYFDILLLGGSVLDSNISDIELVLLKRLTSITKKNIRIHNLSYIAHTSLDSWYKYKYLRDKKFDLLIIYHGINEVRANNINISFFKHDYSHYAWYEKINAFQKHPEINYIAFPYTLKYFWFVIKSRLFKSRYIPMQWPVEELLEYGCVIKTETSLKDNFLRIIELSEIKKTPLLLMSFAYYIPENYSKIRFINKNLDYASHRCPIELWGKPENVLAGITSHNAIIKGVVNRHKNVEFIDQNKLIPKSGQYFDDICHFTHEGSEVFVDNVLEIIVNIVENGNLYKDR